MVRDTASTHVHLILRKKMTKSVVLGGGCFWCLEASFQLINGVAKVTSGYAGDSEETANYYTVASKETNHAEVVKVEFDPNKISLQEILDIFWAIHDPTTLNRQGNDVGPEYRSIIFYKTPGELEIINKSIGQVQKLWPDPVVTEVEPLEKFYPAESEHQNYFVSNPNQAYCQIIINPKLSKLRKKFISRLKE